MPKQTLDAHPALTIAYCSENDKLLLAVYDAGYKRGKGPYPLAANCIGGNPPPGNSPEEVLIREIKEEYDPDAPGPNKENPAAFDEKVAWANPGDIKLVSDALLSGLSRYQDIFVQSTSFGEGTDSYQAIYSYFQNEIPQNVMECAESNLRRQLRLCSEGLTGVFTLEELANDSRGDLTTAHITAHILNYRFPNANIPQNTNLVTSEIGLPRNSFQDYLPDFDYAPDFATKLFGES